MKKNTVVSFIVMVLIVGAAVYLGISAGWWQVNSALDGLWTFLLIVPAIIWMLIFNINFFNSALFFAGFGLLLTETGLVSKTEWVPLLIAMGVMTIALTIKGAVDSKPAEIMAFDEKAKQNDTDTIKIADAFAGGRYTNISENVKEGNISATACKLVYDFSKAELQQDITLKLKASLATIVLIVPKNVKLVVNTNCTCGKLVNRVEEKSVSRTITIQADIKFGKIFVRDTLPENISKGE